MTILTYPEDLGDKPNISFKSRDPNNNQEGVSIVLYAPQSISVNDGMGYGNFDLGVIGSMLRNSVESGEINSENFKSRLEANLGVAGNSGGLTSALIAKALSNRGLGGSVVDAFADASLFNAGKALNPNTVLQFTGPQLRTFGFEFRMVAQSASESATIKQIVDGFRTRMYASKDGDFVLNYPDIWQVKFNIGNAQYIPSYAESYLTSLNTVYNSSGNMYHSDGSPTDVTVQIQFSEFKALGRGEIEKLNQGTIISYSGGGEI